jgi:hypothetical protein
MVITRRTEGRTRGVRGTPPADTKTAPVRTPRPPESQSTIGDELRRYLTHPPGDSAAARARAFGIDVFATARNVVLRSPQERLIRLDEMIEDLKALRAANR